MQTFKKLWQLKIKIKRIVYKQLQLECHDIYVFLTFRVPAANTIGITCINVQKSMHSLFFIYAWLELTNGIGFQLSF
jgi:hypothetical protein